MLRRAGGLGEISFAKDNKNLEFLSCPIVIFSSSFFFKSSRAYEPDVTICNMSPEFHIFEFYFLEFLSRGKKKKFPFKASINNNIRNDRFRFFNKKLFLITWKLITACKKGTWKDLDQDTGFIVVLSSNFFSFS